MVSNTVVGDPRFCDIVIATRCVLKCKMCKAWQCGETPNEISFEEAKLFVRSLADFVKFPLEINVMGGEPLLKEWCLDLCSYIAEAGFKSIISTNAYLIDEDMAKKIAASKLSVLAISLESLNPSTHDFYRGTPGTLAKVMKAIEYLDKHCRGKMAMTILTIIMEKNLDEILEMVEWVNKNDLFVNVSFLVVLETGLVHPRDNWFKRPEYSQLWPQDTKKLYRLIDELIVLRKKGYKIWNPVSQLEAFRSYYTEPDKFMKETEYHVHDYIIDLDENGTIYLSGEPLGNIREDNLKDLWYSEKAGQVRQKIDERGPGKRCCVINFVCAFPGDEEYPQARPEKDIHHYQKMGFYYKDLKQFDKAIDEFKQVLEISPDSQHARIGLGFCYFDQGKIEKAFIEFNQASDLGPENEHVHQGLGSCYQLKKEFDKAVDEFKKALALNPDNYYVHQGLAYCYQGLKQFDMSKDEFKWMLKIHPDNEHYHMGLGCCHEGLRQFDKAIDEFKQALMINPNIECADRCIASCRESLKQLRG
ncbi:MAG: tetratricopeptide repeat protein [Candidatus Omnitrophica bacterium]|nr:tetratricopeptide repeat protein [Candidatus Omnitrophota bacterium]